MVAVAAHSRGSHIAAGSRHSKRDHRHMDRHYRVPAAVVGVVVVVEEASQLALEVLGRGRAGWAVVAAGVA